MALVLEGTPPRLVVRDLQAAQIPTPTVPFDPIAALLAAARKENDDE